MLTARKLITLLLLFTFVRSYAGALQIYELGTPLMGTAVVGQATVNNDASASFFNPAGMLSLCNSQLLLGTVTTLYNAQFKPDENTTILGNSGGNAGTILPSGQLYGVLNYSPNVRLGLSVTNPYGGYVAYTNGWVGRYLNQESTLIVLNVNPSLGIRLTDCFYLGAGVALQYAKLDQKVNFPIAADNDGQIELRFDDNSPGFNVGAMWLPTATTKIGLTYRSQVVQKLKGSLYFLRLPFAPSATSQFVTPQNVILGLSQQVTSCLTLLAETGWAQWSVMDNSIVNIANVTLSSPLHWHDTYRLGVGAELKINHHVTLQTGVSYDSSPTDAHRRLPELPVDEQQRYGAGIIYTTNHNVRLGVSYEFINLGRAAIHNVNRTGTVSGDYPINYMNVLGLNVNFCL